MTTLRFSMEWEDPGQARGDELRATWCRLEIALGTALLTEVHDRAVNSHRTGVYVPAYTVAEWIATHWWWLLEEPHKDDPRFASRHDLRFCREGYALPNMSFVGSGDTVRIIARPLELADYRVSFLSDIDRRLAKSEVAAAFRALLSATCDRLREVGVTVTPLQKEWAAIQGLDAADAEMAGIIGALGLDPFDLPPEVDQLLESAKQSLGPSVLRELCEAIDADRLPSALGSLEELWGAFDVRASSIDLDRLGQPPGQMSVPHQSGYKAASVARQRLGLADEPIPDLAATLGIVEPDVDRAAVPSTPANNSPAKALIERDRDRARIDVLVGQPLSRRFALCRALYRTWTLRRETRGLVTDARTDDQRSGRAFAAAFLAPIEGIRKRLRGAVLDDAAAESLASEFGVSSVVIWLQAENHGIPVAA